MEKDESESKERGSATKVREKIDFYEHKIRSGSRKVSHENNSKLFPQKLVRDSPIGSNLAPEEVQSSPIRTPTGLANTANDVIEQVDDIFKIEKNFDISQQSDSVPAEFGKIEQHQSEIVSNHDTRIPLSVHAQTINSSILEDRIESEKKSVNFDRYGFVKEMSSIRESYGERSLKAVSIPKGRQTIKRLLETEEQRRDRVLFENNLIINEWTSILEKMNSNKNFKYNFLKRRLREGVPDTFRSKVWLYLACRELNCEKAYSDALRNVDLLIKKNDPFFKRNSDSIGRDLNRTLPDHFLFKISDGPGQTSLKNVLLALAAADTEVGYCQGMGFIAAVLLSYLSEAKAYAVFFSLLHLEPYVLRTLYTENMPQVQLRLFQLKQLMKKHIFRLSKHFDELGIVENMYATHWMVTLFSYNFPFDMVLRVWDCFFLYGWKVIFQVGIAILKHEQNALLKFDFEQILEHLRGLPVTLDCEAIFNEAMKIKLSRNELKHLENHYELFLKKLLKSQNKNKRSGCNLLFNC